MVGNVRICRMACASPITTCARPSNSPVPNVQSKVLFLGAHWVLLPLVGVTGIKHRLQLSVRGDEAYGGLADASFLAVLDRVLAKGSLCRMNVGLLLGRC
jgi:hypothetical protein